eukprot:6976014-Lingulodinium_polyedra.AAC.1
MSSDSCKRAPAAEASTRCANCSNSQRRWCICSAPHASMSRSGHSLNAVQELSHLTAARTH